MLKLYKEIVIPLNNIGKTQETKSKDRLYSKMPLIHKFIRFKNWGFGQTSGGRNYNEVWGSYL